MAVSTKNTNCNDSTSPTASKQNGTSSSHIVNADGELITCWNYGRPCKPSLSADCFAYKQLPWKLIYLLWLAVPSLLTAAVFGTTRVWPFVAIMPFLGLLLAFPILAVVVTSMSWLLSPATKGCPQHYFTFNDAKLKSAWTNKKVPIQSLYEAFFAGRIDLAEDPSTGRRFDLLQVLYHRCEFLRFVLQWEHVRFFLLQFIPELLTHSRSQDVDQVREHYDRGDDFYAAFLGPMMIYTSGVFQSPDDTLEQAQLNKMNLVAEKCHMKRGYKHLDIGCGWGTFIAHCAKHYGTDSTGVTLGRNQTEWANRVCREAGVSDSARALCMDYRDIPQATNHTKYDVITCLEMSEHVGVKYYSKFLEQIQSQLKDDGIFFLQIAGLRRAWQYEDFNWGLFMGKYIFPGADASCPLGWVINQLEGAGFEIHSVETIGIHYSATIKRWYDNWLKNEDKIVAKYGQRWFRLWSWFLAWSVISPEEGMATCYQIVCHKNTRRFDRKQYIAERVNYKC